jgi:serine/threonine-protein kinase RsbW
MDWLIDTTDADAGSAHARALLTEHLRRHAAEPDRVEARFAEVSASLSDYLSAAGGRPLHLHLDWTAEQPLLAAALLDSTELAVDGGVHVDQPVPARQRADVRSWPHQDLGTVTVPVPRATQPTFRAGPPPVLADVTLDVEEQGAAAVALALTAALEAHPSASAPQAAAIAGSMIASAGLDAAGDVDAARAAEEFVRLHGLLGSEAYVVAADESSVELAVAKCPFRAAKGGSSAICHVSTGLAGQLGARVHGAATVILDETIVAGDPECHLQVLLGEADQDVDSTPGEPFFWPPRAAAPGQAVPHLDLSVSLPRESASVPVVRRLAAQALRAFGVHDEDVHDVELAISEACGNVIEHAAETDSYDVKVELAADRCTITVVDQGSGFDATALPGRPDDDSEVGRGVALMRALVDNVAFRNEPQAGTVVHMVKALAYDAEHPLHRV